MATETRRHCWEDSINDDVRAIYQNYNRQPTPPKNPALILIDLYNSAYEGGPEPVVSLIDRYPSTCGEHAWNAIAPTKKVIEKCRALDIPIIYCTRDDFTKKSGKFGLESTHRTAFSQNPDRHKIFHEFEPQADDLIIYKNRASIFYGTPLQAYLTQMGITDLIMLGQSTSGCVRASVVDAYSYGYSANVVEDCCFDRNPLAHQANLFDIHHKYASCVFSDEAIELLDRMNRG